MQQDLTAPSLIVFYMHVYMYAYVRVYVYLYMCIYMGIYVIFSPTLERVIITWIFSAPTVPSGHVLYILILLQVYDPL